MKKSIFLVLLLLIGNVGQSQQAKNYKQKLSNNINVIEATGNVIVRVVEDSINYVSVLRTGDEIIGTLVKVDSNRLSTTAAAIGRLITVGTIERNRFTFILSDNAEVLYNGRDYSGDGEFVFDKDSVSGRNWTGLKKYESASRIKWDYFFGSNTIYNGFLGTDGVANDLFKKEPSLKNNYKIAWTVGYSIYMDDHIAFGLGVDIINSSSYVFQMPYLENSSDAVFSAPSVPNPERWTTTINTFEFGLPIHFILFSGPDLSLINFELDLIPKFCYWAKFTNTYHYQDESGTLSVTDDRVLRHNPVGLRRFGLDFRVSAEIGPIGIFAETGILSMGDFKLDDLMQAKYGSSHIKAFHFSFGLKFSFFNWIRE